MRQLVCLAHRISLLSECDISSAERTPKYTSIGSFEALRAQAVQTAAVQRVRAFCNEPSSPTFRQVFVRSIWRIRPHRTLPDPNSRKYSTPWPIKSVMEASHFTAPVTCRNRASRLEPASSTTAASTLHTTDI